MALVNKFRLSLSQKLYDRGHICCRTYALEAINLERTKPQKNWVKNKNSAPSKAIESFFEMKQFFLLPINNLQKSALKSNEK